MLNHSPSKGVEGVDGVEVEGEDEDATSSSTFSGMASLMSSALFVEKRSFISHALTGTKIYIQNTLLANFLIENKANECEPIMPSV